MTTYRHDLLEHYVDQLDELTACYESLPQAERSLPLAPGEWSPHQVVWHVGAVEKEAYLPRLRRLLEADRVELPDFDGAEWMKHHYALSSDVAARLAEVKSLRQEMRARLERAPVSVWGHVGFNPYRGTRTLMWWVERSVAHVAEHIAQLANSAPAAERDRDQEAP